MAHGIFSKGFDKLLDNFTCIGTTDSFFDKSRFSELDADKQARVTVYPAFGEINGSC